MKHVLLANAVLAPFIMALMSGSTIIALLGVVYFGYVVFGWGSTINGKRFWRRAYAETLRLEHDLLRA